MFTEARLRLLVHVLDIHIHSFPIHLHRSDTRFNKGTRGWHLL